MGGLISSGEVNDVLNPSAAGKKRKINKLMENMGGNAIVQLTANIQREVGKGKGILRGSPYKVSSPHKHAEQQISDPF